MSFPPQPTPDQDSEGFWSALNNGELRLQYSPAASRWQFPPLERCRFTGEPLEWRIVGRTGSIVTFIIQHRPVTAGFEALLPYPIALVEPDDAPGVRLPLRIAGTHGEDVAVGGRVRIEIVELPGGNSNVAVARLDDAQL